MAIINNNVQNVKFLRNGSLFASRSAALEAMEAQKANLADGVAILGRYSGKTATDVKTLVGFAYISGETKTLTVFDVEGANADVEALRTEINNKLGTGVGSGDTETVTAQLTALSGTAGASSAETSVAGAKAYAKDYTDEQIDNLDYSGISTSDAAVVTNVTEADGKIAATSANVGNLKLTDYTKGSNSGAVVSTDSINAAVAKLENQIDAEKDARAAAIDALDLAVVSGDGQVIVAVSQENGQVSAEKANLKDVQLGGYEKGSDTGAISGTDTVNVALSKIENNIAAIGSTNTLSAADKSVNVNVDTTGTTVGVNIRSGEKVIKLDTDATSGGVYTDIDLVKITTGLPETVKERYQLLASDDTQLGTNIDIPKDSHIVSITYSGNTQKLYYTYIDVSGNTQTTEVDMGELVLEAEFASGVTVTDHVAHGVVDPNSEKDTQDTQVSFLTVGENGFKVNGIKDEIDRKINALDADKSGSTAHVTVGVLEVDGKISAVTVSESDIANASGLEELSGKTLTEVESSNSSIGVTTAATTDGTVKVDIVTDASKIQMSGFTAADSGFSAITEATTITNAVKAIEIAFIDNEEVTAAALNDLNAKIEELSGGSETSLAGEIANRQRVDGITGSAYTATSTANYISDATSLNDADQKLDAAIDSIAENYVSGITVNGSGLTVSNNIAAVTVTPATSATTATSTEAITVVTDEHGNITLGISTIDCGYYA